jgi:hypothetical protein
MCGRDAGDKWTSLLANSGRGLMQGASTSIHQVFLKHQSRSINVWGLAKPTITVNTPEYASSWIQILDQSVANTQGECHECLLHLTYE